MHTSAKLLAILPVALALGSCGGGKSSSGPVAGAPPVASNAAPTISGLTTAHSVAQDTSGDSIGFTVADAESGASGVRLSVESSNPDLISPYGVQFAGEASARTLVVTPVEGNSGAATLTVTAMDPAGLTTKQTLTVTVTTQPRTFKEFVASAYALNADGDGAQIAGYSLSDDAEADESTFDSLFER